MAFNTMPETPGEASHRQHLWYKAPILNGTGCWRPAVNQVHLCKALLLFLFPSPSSILLFLFYPIVLLPKLLKVTNFLKLRIRCIVIKRENQGKTSVDVADENFMRSISPSSDKHVAPWPWIRCSVLIAAMGGAMWATNPVISIQTSSEAAVRNLSRTWVGFFLWAGGLEKWPLSSGPWD